KLAGGLTVSVRPVGLSLTQRPRATTSGTDATPQAVVRHIRRLAKLFPALSATVESTLAAEPEAAPALLAYCNEWVGATNKASRETQLRNLLVRLRAYLTSDRARELMTFEIARSDLRSGVPE